MYAKNTKFIIGTNNEIDFEDSDVALNKQRSESNAEAIEALNVRVENLETVIDGVAGGLEQTKSQYKTFNILSNGSKIVTFNNIDYMNALYNLYVYDEDPNSKTYEKYVDAIAVASVSPTNIGVIVNNFYKETLKFKLIVMAK